jgi:hypothetical protein
MFYDLQDDKDIENTVLTAVKKWQEMFECPIQTPGAQ